MSMKIVRPICCGMDVHKNLIVATIGITDSNTRITEYIFRNLFLLLILIFSSSNSGSNPTIVLMSAWNQPVSIGSQSLMFLKMRSMSTLLIQRMSKQ